MCAAGSSYARTLRGTCLKRFAASDILSDITLEKSATVGKRKKADEKTTIRELAESARLGEGSRTAASGRKTIPGTPCLPAKFETRIASCSNVNIGTRFHIAVVPFEREAFFAAYSSNLVVFLG
jgi:hypothetical protein